MEGYYEDEINGCKGKLIIIDLECHFSCKECER